MEELYYSGSYPTCTSDIVFYDIPITDIVTGLGDGKPLRFTFCYYDVNVTTTVFLMDDDDDEPSITTTAAPRKVKVEAQMQFPPDFMAPPETYASLWLNNFIPDDTEIGPYHCQMIRKKDLENKLITFDCIKELDESDDNFSIGFYIYL